MTYISKMRSYFDLEWLGDYPLPVLERKREGIERENDRQMKMFDTDKNRTHCF